MKTKVCTKCNKKKEATTKNFRKRKQSKADGLDYQCKDCQKKMDRIYRSKPSNIAYQKSYRQKNNGKLKKQGKEHYKKNKEQILEKEKRRYLEDAEYRNKKINASRSWLKKNRIYAIERKREYYKKNRHIIRTKQNEAVRNASDSYLKFLYKSTIEGINNPQEGQRLLNLLREKLILHRELCAAKKLSDKYKTLEKREYEKQKVKINIKMCNDCGIVFEAAEKNFYPIHWKTRKGKKRSGLNSYCRDCARIRSVISSKRPEAIERIRKYNASDKAKEMKRLYSKRKKEMEAKDGTT